MIVMLLVNATGTLRLPAEAELYGMDLHEHGISAYPEYVLSSLGAPGGMAKDTVLPLPGVGDEQGSSFTFGLI